MEKLSLPLVLVAIVAVVVLPILIVDATTDRRVTSDPVIMNGGEAPSAPTTTLPGGAAQVDGLPPAAGDPAPDPKTPATRPPASTTPAPTTTVTTTHRAPHSPAAGDGPPDDDSRDEVEAADDSPDSPVEPGDADDSPDGVDDSPDDSDGADGSDDSDD